MEKLQPIDLSKRLIEAYNRRDLEGLVSLIGDPVEYIRPGPTLVTSIIEVRRQYRQDWEQLDESVAEIRRAYEAGSTVAAEMTFHIRRGDHKQIVEGAVFHEWREQKLIRYRAYLDIAPP